MNPEYSHERFWDFWLHHQDSLRRQSLRLTRGSSADAEEILSTAMMRAALAFPRHGAAIKNTKAWLHRLVHNVCMDAILEARRYVRSTSGPKGEWDEEPEAGGGQPSPEELLLRHERSWGVRQQTFALPESLRVPLVMRFQQERSYEDIAACLGLTQCNVRKRIQFGTQRLRHALIDES